MRCSAVLSLISVIFLAVCPVSSAIADERINPLDYIDSDAPGIVAYMALIKRFDVEGGEIVEISSTFLGRIRIVVDHEGVYHEVVMSPNTGEIRRDAVLASFRPRGPGNNNGNGKGNNGNGNSNGNNGNGNGGGNGNGNN